MKLSSSQHLLLLQLSKPYQDYEKNHPMDAYNSRTVEALIKHKLIEKYHYKNYLHGALKLTDEGKRVLLNDGSLL